MKKRSHFQTRELVWDLLETVTAYVRVSGRLEQERARHSEAVHRLESEASGLIDSATRTVEKLLEDR